MAEPPDPGSLLEAFVRGRDAECPTCKYNLRDLASAVCPECGEPLVLRLQAENPRVALLVMGLLPLAMALGFFVIVTAFVVGISMWEGDWPPLEYWASAPAIAFVFGLFTLAWVRRWTRVRRWAAGGRLAMISACWGVMSVAAIGFLAMVLNF